MEEAVEIRWHGRGGQGVVTGSELLAEAALLEGKFFQALPEFGAERSGAPIQAYTRISPHPIQSHYAITEPDILIILDTTLLGTIDLTQGLKPQGLIFVNTTASPQRMREKLGVGSSRVYTVDASGIALRTIGRNTPNTPMLGALLAILPLVSHQSLRQAILQRLAGRLAPRVIEANLRALDQAAEAVQGEPGGPAEGAAAAEGGVPAQGPWASEAWAELLPGGVIVAATGDSVAYETGSWRSLRPVIEWDRCTHCMLCWVYCPDSCFETSQGRLVGLDYTHCKGCGICAVQCPPKCIAMVEELAFQEG